MKGILLSLMILLIGNPQAWADGCESMSRSSTQSCTLAQSDTEVNDAYMHLVEVLGKQFKLDQIKALYQAQDAWRLYRDKSCQYLDADFAHAEATENDCLIRLNDERIKQLTQYMTQALVH
ncbi:lysozyme inhibitor LprI family protein [Aquirhabdus parva]|uniref:DUF1311 domain-containing protein n=1 Tax=Aquirhabdus parva TaxID=2283318 RepID=A0A345P302_9GAMM|nr:lysozyme inhibitor LprI family protein [Aquirhabdus parva]AXI01661.1 DUF1311 domain-containing protein [Aquirhabdus parva]